MKQKMRRVSHSISHLVRKEYDTHLHWGICLLYPKSRRFRHNTEKKQLTNSSFVMLYLLQYQLHSCSPFLIFRSPKMRESEKAREKNKQSKLHKYHK